MTVFKGKQKRWCPKSESGFDPKKQRFALQVTATVTVASACAGVAGPASTATARPVRTHASLKTGCPAAGEATASVASVFARTPEPQDRPVNAVLPVAIPATLNGNVSTFFCPLCPYIS